MFRSISVMIVTRCLSIVIGIVSVLLMTRWLGSEDYGRYFFIVTLANFLALPVLAGLPTLVVREIAQARGRHDGAHIAGILRWCIGFLMISSSTVGCLGIAVFLITREVGEPLPSYALALPLIIALGAMQISAAYLQGQERPVLGSLPDGLIRPAVLLLMIIGLFFIDELTPAMAVASHILAAIIAVMWAVSTGRRLSSNSTSSILAAPYRYQTRTWLAGLLPLTVIVGAAVLNNRLDIIMLSWLADMSEVGRYGLALQIAGLVAIGPTIVNSIVLPRIARQHTAGERKTMQHELTHAARLGLALAAVALGVAALFAEPVLLELVGNDFEGAIPALLVLGGARVLISVAGPVGNTLSMTGNASVMAWLTIIFACVNAMLNAILIPLYGALGAAWATGISLTGLHLLMTWQVRKIIGVDTSVVGKPLKDSING